MKAIGAVLVIAGIAAFAWGLSHGGMRFSRQDSVVTSGPAEGSIVKTNSLPLAPIAGGVCVLAGVVLLVAAGNRVRAGAQSTETQRIDN